MHSASGKRKQSGSLKGEGFSVNANRVGFFCFFFFPSKLKHTLSVQTYTHSYIHTHTHTSLCLLESSKCRSEGGESDGDGRSSGHSAGQSEEKPLQSSSVAAPLPRCRVSHLRSARPSDSYQWCVASTRPALFGNGSGRFGR